MERRLAELHRRLAALKIDRQSYVLAIGGGAMLDVVGYAAATLHRGVRLVRMPTTVLAQNDAGVGVKNGINAFGAKNFLGTFARAVRGDQRQPFPVDAAAARPDRRHGRGGQGRVDPRSAGSSAGSTSTPMRSPPSTPTPVEHLIRRCAELHLEHIAGGGDPFEQGNARPLDFGHWAAHKLEMLTDHALRHGEAVAIGIALDSAILRRSRPSRRTRSPGDRRACCSACNCRLGMRGCVIRRFSTGSASSVSTSAASCASRCCKGWDVPIEVARDARGHCCGVRSIASIRRARMPPAA